MNTSAKTSSATAVAASSPLPPRYVENTIGVLPSPVKGASSITKPSPQINMETQFGPDPPPNVGCSDELVTPGNVDEFVAPTT